MQKIKIVEPQNYSKQNGDEHKTAVGLIGFLTGGQ